MQKVDAMALEHLVVKDGKLVAADAEKALSVMLQRQQRQIDALDENHIDWESDHEAMQEFGIFLYVGLTHDLTAVSFDIFPIQHNDPWLPDAHFSVLYHRNVTITELSDPVSRQALIESFNQEIAKDFEKGRVEMLSETNKHITALHEKAREIDDTEEFILSGLGELVAAYRRAGRFGENVTVRLRTSSLSFTIYEMNLPNNNYERRGRKPS